MGKTSYRTCQQIVEKLRTHGFEEEVSKPVLIKFIKLVAGADPRTVNKYLNLLVEFEFLDPVNSKVYKIK